MRHLAEGRDDEPALEPDPGPGTGGGLRHRVHEDMSTTELESSKTTCSASPASWRPRPRSARADRPRPRRRRRARAWSTQLLEGKVPATTRGAGLATPSPAAGPATSWARSTSWWSRPRRPGAGASPGAGRRRRSTTRSGRAHRVAGLAGRAHRSSCRWSRRVAARAARLIRIGDLQVDATRAADRRPARALRAGRLGLARVRPASHRSTDETEGAQ